MNSAVFPFLHLLSKTTKSLAKKKNLKTVVHKYFFTSKTERPQS